MNVSRRRLLVVAAALITWTIVVVARLAQVQLARHDEYVVRAQRQQERTISLTPLRGSILDARGHLLAESVVAESVWADPQEVTDAQAVAKVLAGIRGVDVTAAEIERRLRRRGEFAWIARQVSPEVAAEVRALALRGVYLLEEHRRAYPKQKLASNLVGYVGLDGEGLAGLEHAADPWVRGRAGKVTLLRDARRGMYMVGGEGSNAPVDGHNVVLTIDEVVQFVTERALAAAVEKYRARAGVAIVMEPSTGKILGMASIPTFDPNDYGAAPASHWRNRAVQDLYEPGSTFKVITAAAALEEGVVTASQVIDCSPGYYEIGSTRIREHGGKRFDLLTFEQVLAQSSNVGTIRVGVALGPQRLHDWVTRFGFGRPTGIELPGEASGIVRPTAKWSALSNATISMGQEIAVTPLQLVQAFATIANDGVRVAPRIVDRVVDADGNVIHAPPAGAPVRVVSQRTAVVLGQMLETAVANGTGKAAAVEGYTVAGKTGTAQKAGRGGYLPDSYVASFAGYVPADRPRLAIVIAIDEPRGGHYGGTVAAPVFREIAEPVLRYLGVEPALPRRGVAVGEPLLAGFSQPPLFRGAPGAAGESLPDLRGIDARRAIALATASGFRVTTSGTGVVVAQAIAHPGEGRELKLTLSPSGGDVR
jgi:cell division protein FtsI (penicillin-binding protein 3)